MISFCESNGTRWYRFANWLCVLLTCLIELWISPSCSYEFNVAYVQREKSQHLYTTTTYQVHTFKNKKIKSLRDILYPFIRSCKFAIIETCSYDIAHDENAISSKYIIGSVRKQSPVFSKCCSWKFRIFIGKYLCWSLFLIKIL